jgi:hypothetical protein
MMRHYLHRWRRVVWTLTFTLGASTSNLFADPSDGSGTGSTNLDRLSHFWSAVEASNGPVTVLAYGDSMSMGYQSIATQLIWPLRARLGTAGVSITDGTYGIIPTADGGGGGAAPDTHWWAWHFHLPAEGSIYWTNWDDATGTITADEVGLYWISGPGGGEFTFRVSTDGGAAWQLLAVLDGASSEPAGHATNFTIARMPCWLRVDGVSGTNVIVAPQFLDRTSSGVNVAFIDCPGASLDQVFALSTNVSYPILAALNPQLVIWHMKELGDIGETGLSNRLYDLEDMWQAAVTNGDVLYIGTPYDVRDSITNYTPIETRLVKEAAVRGQRAYLDCMSPGVSYEWMEAHGYMADAVHANSLGDAFLASVGWRELTWSALRVDRHLSLEPGLEGLQLLTWPTATDLNYELQASEDLRDWAPVPTTAGDGARQYFRLDAAASGNRWFRLKVTSN